MPFRLIMSSTGIFNWIWSVFRFFRRLDSLQHKSMVVAGSPVVLSKEVVWVQLLGTEPLAISRVSLFFGTFQRKNTCQVEIRLYSESDDLLYSEAIVADTLEDNAFYVLKLPADFTYQGRFYLSVASPDASPGNCVALWTQQEFGCEGLREIPRLSRVVSDITPANGQGTCHPGIGLVVKLMCHRLGHVVRSYRRIDQNTVMRADLPTKVVGLVGCSAGDKQVLLSFNDQTPLRLHEVKADGLNQLSQCQSLLITSNYEIDQGRMLARYARRRKIPLIVVALEDSPIPSRLQKEWPSFADGLIAREPQLVARIPQASLLNGLLPAVNSIRVSYVTRMQPKVSIVALISRSSANLKWVIESYFNQTYRGEVEVVYVNDCFGGDADAVVEAEFARNSARPHAPRLTYLILSNERNLGNCASRNRGVSAASGDIVVIIDADCMLNRQFIAAHVDAHAYLDCEVVIGPHNIETHGAPPLEKLTELECTPLAPLEESELQDPLFLDGFLNCITRNFSIKRSAIVEDLFDLNFSYSLAPVSGFGWEDVEMGYRLYKRGLGIKFTEDAYSVHISHGSSSPESERLRKSIRSFRKLFLKHPELRDVARRWAVRTLESLDGCSVKVDPTQDINEDLAALRRLFSDAPRAFTLAEPRRRKLRILTYRWHVPHQYELYKSGHDFFLVRGTGSSMCDQWEYGQRPLPANANFINIEDVRESDFDLALLHFDENVLNHENTNGQIGLEWGAAFRYFVEQVNLPKVAICHGTPQFYGQYTPGYDKPDLMTVIEPARAALVDYVKDIEIVCNSHQAQREWGFHKSRVIWHGFDPSEFLPATYSKGILSPLGPLVKSRPHYRGFYLYQQVFSPEFPEIFLPETLSVPDPDIDYVENVFAITKYKNYIDQIRQYSVYFNPTLRSPMPRARCEPMMCGVVTVNANNHDVDMFIKNGANGFYSNDPDELREQLLYLMRNPEATRKMGAEARKTAIDVFNHDRYLADWAALLKSVV